MAGISDIPIPIRDIDLEAKAVELGIDYFMPTVCSLHLGIKAPIIPTSSIRDVQQKGYGLHGMPEFAYGGKDPECRMVPDPTTLIRLPWKPNFAWLACYIYIRGKPSPRCPRAALKKQLERLTKHGYSFKCGFEAEFMLFKEDTFDQVPKTDTNVHGYYDANITLSNSKVMCRILDTLNSLGWKAYQAEKEYSGGQYELNYGYTDAMAAADRFVFYKFAAKAIAREEGMRIIFMPLYNAKASAASGCGLHINASIWNHNTDTNAMDDKNKPLGVSDVGRQFTAGVMKHLCAMSPILCPTPNGFKRLHIIPAMVNTQTWGIETKTTPMRIVKENGEINRFEFRMPDGSCNPYLAVATFLSAGLDGIEMNLEPPESQRCEEEIVGLPILPDHIKVLPKTLELGIAELKADEYLMKSLGKELLDSFIFLKEFHLTDYYKEITDYELSICDNY